MHSQTCIHYCYNSLQSHYTAFIPFTQRREKEAAAKHFSKGPESKCIVGVIIIVQKKKKIM